MEYIWNTYICVCGCVYAVILFLLTKTKSEMFINMSIIRQMYYSSTGDKKYINAYSFPFSNKISMILCNYVILL